MQAAVSLEVSGLSENPFTGRSTPPTQRQRLRGAALSTGEETASLLQRPRRAATIAGQERAAAVEAKFCICKHAEKEACIITTISVEVSDAGDRLPPADVPSDEEIECSPGTLEVQLVHKGPY
eukprot:1745943-Rhodomonas_salina.1